MLCHQTGLPLSVQTMVTVDYKPDIRDIPGELPKDRTSHGEPDRLFWQRRI